MKFAKIENGVVVQIQPGKEKGFVEVDDGTVCGMVVVDGGELANPAPPTPSVETRISALERQVTPRNLRGAALGDQFAIDHIQSVEDEISTLRKQMSV